MSSKNNASVPRLLADIVVLLSNHSNIHFEVLILYLHIHICYCI